MAEILVIDDEPEIRGLIARVLTRKGHVVHQAANGREGLQLFQQLRPAAVITDIVMPEGEGIETIQELRRRAPQIPILAISGGSAEALYLRAAVRLGASASLQKPFDLGQFTAVVTDLLK
jgi:DNA-binding response OmpR family regulator